MTVAVQCRSCPFGEVIGQQLHLNAAGEIASRVCRALPERFPHIALRTPLSSCPTTCTESSVLRSLQGRPLSGARPPVQHHPDRAATRAAPTGGGVTLGDVAGPDVGAPLVGARPRVQHHPDRAATRAAPTGGRATLGDVVGAYKSLVTLAYIRGIKKLGWRRFDGQLWQRSYYEHVVRNDESLDQIRRYVQDNPARWAFDRENPLAIRPADP